jgi:hypothetical protein
MIVFHLLFYMLVMGPAAMLGDIAASPPTSGPPPERLTGRARELASECSAVRWDTSTLLRGMTAMQETLAAMQATMDNQATELAAVRSELTSVRAAALRAQLSATRAAGYSGQGRCYLQPGQHGPHHPAPGGHQQQPGQIGKGGKGDEEGCEAGQRH